MPRYVETKQRQDFDVENILKQTKKVRKQHNKYPYLNLSLSNALVVQDLTGSQPLKSGWLRAYEDEITGALWDQSGVAWKSLLDEELKEETESEYVVVAVGHPALHIGMMGHCLNLTKEWLGSFHLDAGSISVVDFPDGPTGRGVIRCINYTAHLGRWSIPITRSTLDDENF